MSRWGDLSIKPSMKLTYILYVLGLIGVLLFAANCKCDKDDAPEQKTVMSLPCLPTQAYVPGMPPTVITLSNGTKVTFPGTPGHVVTVKVPCPNTTNSNIWAKSQHPVYGSGATSKSKAHLAGRASSSGPAAYLPQVLLDLPFSAQSSASDVPPSNCDPAQPDVIAVDHDNAMVDRFGTCPFQMVATIPVATRPLQIDITPDGKTALVTSFDNAINFIDLGTNKVTFTLPTGSLHPNGIAITPDGAFAYFTNYVPTASDSSISKIDLSTRTIVQTIPAAFGPYAQNLFLSPDGSQLYVTYPYQNVVQVLDTLTNAPITNISVPAPRGIAFNSKGTKAYIAGAGNPDNATLGVVEEFDTNTFQPGPMYQAGLCPNDIAVLYSDQYVITVNYEGQSVSVIDTVSGTAQTTNVGGQIAGLSILR